MGTRRGIFVALLRGINVGGQHKIPMAELRALCTETGCEDVQTYIQSGNVVLAATATPTTVETHLERAIEQKFGFFVPVVVRSSAKWRRYIESNPFPDASRLTPNFVVLELSKALPLSDAVDGLQKRATHGERLVQVDDVFWIHYPGGIGQSKLSPAVLDRLVGSPVTARNWRTALELDRMMQQLESTGHSDVPS